MANDLRVVVSGSSGLIGTALIRALRDEGYQVTRLVRREAKSASEIRWDPEHGHLDPQSLAGATAVISLGGSSVGRLPWTPSYRNTLITSRIQGTRTIVNALHELHDAGHPVPSLISASASGYYGSQPGTTLTEHSQAGDTFLAKLCVAWEAEARRAEAITRVALLRTAPVLHPRGVLRPMILLTRAGLGGPLGSGTQHWPWISLDDEVRGIVHVLRHGIVGPVNLTGPEPSTNGEITRLLARHLGRPSFFRVPEFALRAVLGSAATVSLLTSDARVVPHVLEESGFRFHHPTASAAIAAGA